MARRITTILIHSQVQEDVEQRLEDHEVDDRWEAFAQVGQKYGYAPRTVKDIYYDKTVSPEQSPPKVR